MTPLSERDLAALHVRFIAPLAVSSMLHGEEVLDDIAEYTLKDIISEFEPDEALLAIASCAQHIAAHTIDLSIGMALCIEADKIMEEYGPVWLAHEAGHISPDDPEVMDLMMNVPEDLEALSDLLMATGSMLDEDRAIGAILCDILSEMADLHREYAENQLDDLELPVMQRAPSYAPEEYGRNIVPFPGRPRKKA